MKLGEKINFLRKQHKLTMQQLADKSNLSKGYISMLEKGINPQTKKEIIPSLETVQYIANAFNVSLETLLENVDSDVELIKHNNIEETEKQPSDISTKLEQMMQELANQQEALMFRGEPMDDETKEAVLLSMQQAMRFAEMSMKNKDNKEE